MSKKSLSKTMFRMATQNPGLRKPIISLLKKMAQFRGESRKDIVLQTIEAKMQNLESLVSAMRFEVEKIKSGVKNERPGHVQGGLRNLAQMSNTLRSTGVHVWPKMVEMIEKEL